MFAYNPTPYAEINKLLSALLQGVRIALQSQFVGMYLHGSLASGDFDPRRSDIDFLVVTAKKLNSESLHALEVVHNRISNSGLEWALRLEGSYIPQQALRRYHPGDSCHPALRVGGHFGIEPHGSDWVIQRYLIRRHGITLAGPLPTSLIDPVGPDQLQQAVRRVLLEWWGRPDVLARLEDSEYQAYAVLTMCRALYTLQYGDVVSKSAAARWAQQQLGQQWSQLIEKAQGWCRGVELQYEKDARDSVKYVLNHAKSGYAE